MARHTTRDGLFEVNVTEVDVTQAVDFSKHADEPPVVNDYIEIEVKSPDGEQFKLQLEFDNETAIALGQDIAKQGRSAKRDKD